MTLALLLAPVARGQGSSTSQAPTAQQVQLSGRGQGGSSVVVQQSAAGNTSSSVNTLNPAITVQGNYAAASMEPFPGAAPSI